MARAVLVLILASSAAHADEIILNDNQEIYPLGKSIKILEDSMNDLTYKDIISGSYDDLFIQSGMEVPNFGFSNAGYWIKFSLGYTSSRNTTERDWLLEIGYPLLDRIELYIRESSGDFRTHIAGDLLPFDERVIKHRTFIFPVTTKTNSILDIYIHVKTESSSEIPITIWSPAKLTEKIGFEQICFGIYYGIVLVMIMYNFFLFFSLKEKNYIYYVFFISGYLFFQLSLLGHAFQFLWGNQTWWANHAVPFFAGYTGFWGGLFSLSFLNAKENTSRPMYFTLIVFTWILGFVTLLSFIIRYALIIKIDAIMVSLQAAMLLINAAFCVKKGNRPAVFYLIGWFGFLLGVLFLTSKLMSLLPSIFITNYAIQIGSALQIIFLSLGLGDRINMERREKILAQQKAITAHEEAVENLTRADKLKDEYLANTSHELRTPLNGIICIAESLIVGAAGTQSDETRENLTMIVSSGKRLASLVNDILDYSKLKNRDLVLQKRPLDLYQISEIIITLSRPLLLGKDIIMTNKVPSDLPYALGDENRVQQILHNLVGNSAKFTESGEISISARARDEEIEIQVSDTGIGIPGDKLDSIFQSFEQVDGSIEREYGGTGLGLAITRSLIELHGGIIGVESQPGKGSTFFFTLPRASADMTVENKTERKIKPVLIDTLTRAGEHPRRTHDLGPPDSEQRTNMIDRRERTHQEIMLKARVLVVDDEPVNIQIIRNNLVLEGAEVYTASSGPEALELLDTIRPDLILLDIMMPKMNGFETARRIRESYAQQEMPIIFLTAKNQVKDMVDGFGAGGNDYITKPFSRNELITRIAFHLRFKETVAESTRLASIDKELELARMIQCSTVPMMLPEVNGIDIGVCFVPMESIGGDFYDFKLFDQGMSMLVTDVSGHGVPAALIASMVKVVFSLHHDRPDDAEGFMRSMNMVLRNTIEHQFITAAYCYIDLAQKKIMFSRAGHEPLLILRGTDKSLSSIKPQGRIIEAWIESSYASASTDIAAGDRIVLYTDGISEARSLDGALFDDRFKELIRGSSGTTAQEFADSVIEEIKLWTGRRENFDDDLTLIVVDIV